MVTCEAVATIGARLEGIAVKTLVALFVCGRPTVACFPLPAGAGAPQNCSFRRGFRVRPGLVTWLGGCFWLAVGRCFRVVDICHIDALRFATALIWSGCG